MFSRDAIAFMSLGAKKCEEVLVGKAMMPEVWFASGCGLNESVYDSLLWK